MAFLIGIDEAGYGPNLGPLVIGGTLWRVPEPPNDLYDLLESVFCRPCTGKAANEPKRLVIGDSKRLFRGGSGLHLLELPVAASLEIRDQWPVGAAELLQSVAGISHDHLRGQRGYEWDSIELPQAIDNRLISQWAVTIRNAMAGRNVEFCRLAATVVFPGPWNQGLKQLGNKAGLLGGLSCRLAARLMAVIEELDPANQHAVYVFCDKQGGRNHYAAMLQEELATSFVSVVSESREQSTYRWTRGGGGPVETSFTARGEAQMPVALASMLAKYLRELSMIAWNRFWQKEVPDLRPTAGYPLDARRFHREIACVQKALAIETNSIWRTR